MTSTPKDTDETKAVVATTPKDGDETDNEGTIAAVGIDLADRDSAALQLVEFASYGMAVQVKDFVSRNANVNYQDQRGMTALHHAAAIGARPCIRILVASGRCNYLLKDKQNRYAYELAAEWAGDMAVARLLARKQRQQAALAGIPAWSKP